MKKRIKKHPRYPGYELVDTQDVITFGTSIFIRKDKRAIIILFPAGQEMHFKPEEEIVALDTRNTI